MLQYPSIPGFGEAVRKPQRRDDVRRRDSHAASKLLNSECVGFNKYDGSNLRWEWSPKSGWSKFGTRKTMFDASTQPWSQAIPLFMDTMASEIEYKAKHYGGKKLERITAFTEFFGPSSFAGQHSWDEAHELRLFDVFLFKSGFIQPKQFLELFGKQPWCAEVIYKGPLTYELHNDVLNGVYPISEGIVCKGVSEEFTVKLKTKAWYTKLKERFAENWEQYA